MDGLIVKKRWLNLILSGKKTIEIRGSNTKKIGQPIYLLESGTNLVKGTCIIDSTCPISCSDWSEEREKHCVDISYSELKKRYKRPHAWVLRNVKLTEEEWKYEHPKGAIIWVKNVMPAYELQVLCGWILNSLTPYREHRQEMKKMKDIFARYSWKLFRDALNYGAIREI